MKTVGLIALMVGTVIFAVPGHASDDSPYSIMQPERSTPGVAPTYQSPRGTRQHVTPLPTPIPPQQRYVRPPPIFVPQTGRAIPSLPVTPRGFVPGGRAETFGDRATRCTQQAGLAGLRADQRGAYMGSCLSQ